MRAQQCAWLAILCGCACAVAAKSRRTSDVDHSVSIYRLDAVDIDGTPVELEKYAGRVSLFVNIATKDAAAEENLAELNALYNKYHNKGFEVLAFPCNQFGQQEPHTNRWLKQARPASCTSRSVRRALLMPQVMAGSLYRCGKRT